MVNRVYSKTSLIIIIFAILINNLNCKPKINFETTGLININYHTGNFKGFPGYDCCGNFTDAVGMGFFVSVGGLQNNLFTIGNTNFGLFVELAYTGAYGKFSNDEYFADVIIGNNVAKGISKHTLETSIQSFELIPGLRISNPFGIKPLFIKLSPSFLLPLSSNFRQREELISPKEATFENGSRIRNSYSGSIPQLISPIIIANMQVGYELISFNTFTISPVISVNYALNKNVKNLDWQTHSFGLGINIRYALPKPKPAVPTPPPPTNLPKPIEPKPQLPIQAKLLIESADDKKAVQNFDTIKIVKSILNTIEIKPIPAIIFYRRNDFLFGYDTIPTTNEFEQIYSENRKVIEALLSLLKRNKDITLTILCSQTEDEQPNICDLRVTRVVEFLRSNGFGDRIKEVKKISTKPKKQIPELIDELRFVQFILNDNKFIIPMENAIKSDTLLTAPRLNIQILTDEKTEYKVNGGIQFNGSEISLNSGNYSFDLKEQLPDFNNKIIPLNVQVEIETLEDLPRKENIESTIYIAQTSNDTSFYTYFNPFKSQNAILVALFNFDESEFYWKNPKIQEIIVELQKQGKKVSIVGSVDNIGSEEHNQRLALARAQRVKNLVGIALPVKAIESASQNGNNTPLERILNRSAWLIVE